jgi:hypothetical protein
MDRLNRQLVLGLKIVTDTEIVASSWSPGWTVDFEGVHYDVFCNRNSIFMIDKISLNSPDFSFLSFLSAFLSCSWTNEGCSLRYLVHRHLPELSKHGVNDVVLIQSPDGMVQDFWYRVLFFPARGSFSADEPLDPFELGRLESRRPGSARWLLEPWWGDLK